MASNPPGMNKTTKAGAITAAIAAATAAVATFTMTSEGTIYKAYQDPVGIWTICDGHTKGVSKGQTATKAQCLAYFKEDMHQAMYQDLMVTPNLIQNNNALQAAGDLTFNGGIGAYRNSPIQKHFAKGEWVQGCNAFVGWWDTASSKIPLRNVQCTYHPNTKKYSCKLPGLVSRRVGEKNICLGQGKPTPNL